MAVEPISGYRKVVAWQRAMDLTVDVYGVSKSLSDNERIGLISQMQRSASSIPANIAEGYGRGSDAEYARFLSIAYGSLCELETFVQLAFRLEYISEETHDRLLGSTSSTARVLYGLKRRIEPDRRAISKPSQ